MTNSQPRPSLLVLVGDPGHRLALIGALRDEFRVLPDDPSRTAMKRVRDLAPELVIVAVDPRNPRGAISLCRTLKTDLRPTPVAVIDPMGAGSAEEVMETAEGYARGQLSDERLVAWIRAVLAGRRPVEEAPLGRRSLLKRLLRRG
ncbi:MAG TPA: hypothetical protein QGF58_18445 [Myxococcota bacterium]|nr:hypothetical protein [Myxococcota bacterium]